MRAKKDLQPDFSKIAPMLWRRYWTWTELRKRANISPSILWDVKAGRKLASPITVYKIADALGVDVSEVVKKGV